MPEINFDMSGAGAFDMQIGDVQQLAVELGFVKEDVDPAKPLAARADMKGFFDMYGVKSLSLFKKRFFAEPLQPISPGSTPMPAPAKSKKKEDEALKKKVHVDPKDVPDVAKFDELSESFPKLKWRIISRPGGATMKPLDFYRLMACVKQVAEGDVQEEKPMWASHGGLDFDGREAWDSRNAIKGTSAEDAKSMFCQVYAEAHADKTTNFRMYG